MSNVYQKALDHWGFNLQIAQTQEECAELIVVLNKFFNRKLNHISLADVAAEIADVEIMCEQMRLIVGTAEVDRYKIIKIRGLREALDA